jgi:molybdopterin converting factor subunit 1
MTIRVLMFATLAQKTGAASLSIDLDEGATVRDAMIQLKTRHPVMAELEDKIATAVNMAYVKGDHKLADGDELALIPPVSGG